MDSYAELTTVGCHLILGEHGIFFLTENGNFHFNVYTHMNGQQLTENRHHNQPKLQCNVEILTAHANGS